MLEMTVNGVFYCRLKSKVFVVSKNDCMLIEHEIHYYIIRKRCIHVIIEMSCYLFEYDLHFLPIHNTMILPNSEISVLHVHPIVIRINTANQLCGIFMWVYLQENQLRNHFDMLSLPRSNLQSSQSKWTWMIGFEDDSAKIPIRDFHPATEHE